MTYDQERDAIDALCKQLGRGTGFYIWDYLGSYLFKRIPNPKAHVAEAWLEKENVELIHVCSPIDFVRFMHHRTAGRGFAGYIREGVCTACKFTAELTLTESNKQETE